VSWKTSLDGSDGRYRVTVSTLEVVV